MNVDPVKQRPADLAQVPLDDAGRTAAFEVVLLVWTKKRQSLDRAAGC